MQNSDFTIYVIHHSHTDIGYTDYQEKLELYHVYFIKEVIGLLNQIHEGKQEWNGFKWNCESFWCVERFLNSASEQEKNDFVKYVKSGEIGISGNYLNLTELIDYTVLSETISRSMKLLKDYDIHTSSALTADINGYSWGYSDALFENGIQNLMSCIHTHHGYHPLFKKQTPFYWQSPNGNKLLVWNGEHYLIGNELGLASTNSFEYSIRDGLDSQHLDKLLKAEKRIETYVRVLKQQGHPYDFVPVSLSALMTDNSPSNTDIAAFINQYNESHINGIQLKMVTLDEFFDVLRQSSVEIPTYSGDWTDWWADGVGSTPNVVKHYREANRKFAIARNLDPNGLLDTKKYQDKTAYNLMFYAEHTWGYCSSVSEPWEPYVNNLDLRKSLYAQKANEYASRAVDRILASYGETPLSLHGDLSIHAVNPNNIAVKDVIYINIETLFGHNHFDIIDCDTKEAVLYQFGSYARGTRLCIAVSLEPLQHKQFKIQDKEPGALTSAGNCAKMGIEGINDIKRSLLQDLENGAVVSPYRLENEYFSLVFKEEEGICSLFDKKHQKELIKSDAPYPAFTPIYEVTDITTTQCDERRRMGRNRKNMSTRRYQGRLTGVTVLADGPVYTQIELRYQLEGTQLCNLILTAFKTNPRLDIDLRCHKNSVWNPENLYVCLPFTCNESEEEIWIDKTGALLRPRIDQLPGTCTDFYAVQNAVGFVSKKNSVLVTMPDTPLIMMGDIKAHEIKLCKEEGVVNKDNVYSWIMNNFWETNFKVDLGGFHQYHYSLMVLEGGDSENIFQKAVAANLSVLGFSSFQ